LQGRMHLSSSRSWARIDDYLFSDESTVWNEVSLSDQLVCVCAEEQARAEKSRNRNEQLNSPRLCLFLSLIDLHPDFTPPQARPSSSFVESMKPTVRAVHRYRPNCWLTAYKLRMCFCFFVCFSVITRFFYLAILSGPTLLISCIAYCNNLNHFYF
jgi:hypothetical protein